MGRRIWRTALVVIAMLGAVLYAAPVAGDTGPSAPTGEIEGAEPADRPGPTGGGGDGEAVAFEDGYLWHSNGSISRTYAGNGSSTYRYNPGGGNIVVTRTGVGVYTVQFQGPNRNQHPQVTAYTSLSRHCNLAGYIYPGNSMTVRCWDSAGNPVDEEFTVRYNVTNEDAKAFISSGGIVCCGTNPWGGAITATRTAVGRYTVTTPGGPNFEGGMVMVTANAAGSTHCKVDFWGSTTADVSCYNDIGSYADSGFSFVRIGSEDDAYAWANNETSTTTYTTATGFSHNPQGTNPTARKTATGRYVVNFPGHLVDWGGSVTVVAYGEANTTKCSVVGWSNASASVSCSVPSGNAFDAQFNLIFTRFRVCEGVPANIEIGNTIGGPTNGDDVIIGTAGDDTIFAGGGNDRVCGEAGNDMIVGQAGNDVIYGGPGNDTMSGNDGNDQLIGEAGDDTAFGGSGNDGISGAAGNDRLGGSSGFDVIFGGDDADIISGGSDSDGLISGGNGNDAVNGGGGDDNNVHGDAGDDTVSGNGGNDVIFGDAGNDEVRGGNGNDQVNGGDGDDFLAGNGGLFDVCDGGLGIDSANTNNCETIINVP